MFSRPVFSSPAVLVAALAVVALAGGCSTPPASRVASAPAAVVAVTPRPGASVFVDDHDGPLPEDRAELRPHELIVRNALPVVAEQTWRLDHASLTPAERAAAHAARARARADLRQFDAARADLDLAITLAPAAAEWRRQRAWLLGALGRDTEALVDLAVAFRAEPQSTRTARVLGLLRFEQGRFADAVAALSFRLDSEPTDPPMRILHAIARIRMGEAVGPDELHVIADSSRDLDPWPQAITLFMAGRLQRADLLASGRTDTADPAPARACQAWFYLGQRSLLDGDLTRAARDFRNAVRTGGTSAIEFRFTLAELARLKM